MVLTEHKATTSTGTAKRLRPNIQDIFNDFESTEIERPHPPHETDSSDLMLTDIEDESGGVSSYVPSDAESAGSSGSNFTITSSLLQDAGFHSQSSAAPPNPAPMATQAGQSAPGGTGASVGGPHMITQPVKDYHEIVYEKTHQIYTGGYQWNNFNNPSTGTFQNHNCLITSLAVYDPDNLPQFMTPQEFVALPHNAYAIKSTCKITPLYYRTPFPIGDTAPGAANAQTGVQIMMATGLNKIMNCGTSGYTASSATNLTKVTALSNPAADANFYYGSTGADPSNLGLQIGLPKHYNNYLQIYSPAGNGVSDGRAPDLMRYAKIINVNDVKGIQVCDHEYHYKNGMIKFPKHYVSEDTGTVLGQPATGIIRVIPEGNRALGWWSRNHKRTVPIIGNDPYYDIGHSGRGDKSNSLTENANTINGYYTTFIEKAPYMTRNVGHHHEPDAPPLCCFGVLPLQSNAALASTPTYSDVVVQWEVKLTLTVGVHFKPLYPGDYLFPIQSYDPSFGFSFDALAGQVAFDATTQQIYIQGRKALIGGGYTDYDGARIAFPNFTVTRSVSKRMAEEEKAREEKQSR